MMLHSQYSPLDASAWNLPCRSVHYRARCPLQLAPLATPVWGSSRHRAQFGPIGQTALRSALGVSSMGFPSDFPVGHCSDPELLSRLATLCVFRSRPGPYMLISPYCSYILHKSCHYKGNWAGTGGLPGAAHITHPLLPRHDISVLNSTVECSEIPASSCSE